MELVNPNPKERKGIKSLIHQQHIWKHIIDRQCYFIFLIHRSGCGHLVAQSKTERTTIILLHTLSTLSTITMTSWCPPPLRHIQIIRTICPSPSPLYTTRGIRSYRRCLLLQQRLLRQLIRLLGRDYIISATIENYPDRPQILKLGQLWIFEGDLSSVVLSGRNHLYVGGLTLLTSPLPRIDNVYIAVNDAVYDNAPLQYY